MQVDSKTIVPHLITCMNAGLVPMISGDPGIGKSEIVQQIAKRFSFDLVDVRLSQCDPTDLNGFPTQQGTRASYIPMDLFPLQDTEIPKNKKGFLIFLDELNSAPMAVQAASYKLILDRCVGQHKLHDRAAVIGAGNLATNNAIVNKLGTAMQSRMVHFELVVNAEHWLEWATQNTVDTRITSFVHHRPELLHKFDPKHTDMTFACPRTWVFASKLIDGDKSDLRDKLPLLAGTISEGVAREFQMHTELCMSIPDIQQIIANPENIPLPDGPAMLYGASHMIASFLTKDNIDTIIKYIKRFPIEFETITLQQAIKRDRSLENTQAVNDWVTIRASKLF